MATYVNPGLDASGNGNNWTTNNINWTSPGVTFDTMTDVPTLTSATQANYATWNPLVTTLVSGSGSSVTNGNLTLTSGTSTSDDMQYPTTIVIPTNGKVYAEFFCANNVYAPAMQVGVVATSGNLRWISNGSSVPPGITTTFTTNDLIGVAYDDSTKTATFYKNGSSVGSLTTTMTGDVVFFANGTGNSGARSSWSANFGQRPFAYTPPTGFVTLNTYNLPTPTIGATASSQANKYFDATLYTGTGATQTITNSGSMQPDLVWVKVRSTSGTHILTDSVRGANKQLFSNLTNAEATATNKITGFTSSGFTLGADDGSGTGDANFNGSTYVGWQWRASNTTPVTNTAGSITSTVSANTTNGFSVVSYTAPPSGGPFTVGHGLGVAPSMIIVKCRDTSGDSWQVYHKSLGNATSPRLNETSATYSGYDWWNSTSPTSTVFSLGTRDEVDRPNNKMIAYCWVEVAGFSKFGSYTGNGSSDGPFIYTGFRPAYIMVKRSDSTGAWFVLDNKRDTYNYAYHTLNPNASDSEYSSTSNAYDFLSNGFKLRQTNADQNASGGTYIYMAFAENPFKYSLAR